MKDSVQNCRGYGDIGQRFVYRHGKRRACCPLLWLPHPCRYILRERNIDCRQSWWGSLFAPCEGSFSLWCTHGWADLTPLPLNVQRESLPALSPRHGFKPYRWLLSPPCVLFARVHRLWRYCVRLKNLVLWFFRRFALPNMAHPPAIIWFVPYTGLALTVWDCLICIPVLFRIPHIFCCTWIDVIFSGCFRAAKPFLSGISYFHPYFSSYFYTPYLVRIVWV